MNFEFKKAKAISMDALDWTLIFAAVLTVCVSLLREKKSFIQNAELQRKYDSLSADRDSLSDKLRGEEAAKYDKLRSDDAVKYNALSADRDLKLSEATARYNELNLKSQADISAKTEELKLQAALNKLAIIDAQTKATALQAKTNILGVIIDYQTYLEKIRLFRITDLQEAQRDYDKIKGEEIKAIEIAKIADANFNEYEMTLKRLFTLIERMNKKYPSYLPAYLQGADDGSSYIYSRHYNESILGELAEYTNTLRELKESLQTEVQNIDKK